jgi:hypothetical protein
MFDIDRWLELAHRNPQIAAGVVGVFLSIAATQFLKAFVPPSVPNERYKAYVRLIGFFAGWFFGYGAWRIFDPTGTKFADMYWAAGIGFLSPLTYSIVIPLLVKRWPYMDAVFSGRPGTDGPH